MPKEPGHPFPLFLKDHSVSGKNFELRYDKELDLLRTFPQPKPEELPAYYKSEKYISHTDASTTFADKIYQGVKLWMTNQKLKWISGKKEGGKILDIGAGTGDFLMGAKKSGWEVFGAEPSSGARSLAKKKGITLSEDTSTFEPKKFDVITLWHVLEHVPDVDEMIREIDRLLKPDGLLIIAVPNFRSHDAKEYKEFWAAYDVPRHLYHFSKKAVKKIFAGHKFGITKTEGMPFDSFYVSMLSEKYRKGNFIRGIFHGFLSNFKARSSGEYSSVAYFLRKLG